MSQQIALHGGTPIRTKPWPKWPIFTKEDKEAVCAVLDDGRMTSITGPKVKEFEDKFAAKFGVKYALATGNGVLALHMALTALGVGPGDEVIVPAHTFIGTSIPVVMANAVPVFVDINIETFNIDVSKIEAAITPRTKAIIPVHLNGLPAEMDEVMRIAKKYSLKVLEDTCQGHGAYYKGRLAGTFGDAACFSFFEDKVLTTGEGGMMITNDEAVYEKARSVRSYGEPVSRNIGDRKYEHTELGFNYRMGSLNAALGINQIVRMDEMVQKRNKNAAWLRERLAKIPGIIPPKEFDYCRNAYYKFVCRINPTIIKINLESFIEAVKAEGIPSTPRYPKPLPLQEVYRNLHGYGNTHCPFDCEKYGVKVDYSKGSWPMAERVGREAFVLLVHPSIEEEDLEDAAAAVKKVADYYSIPG